MSFPSGTEMFQFPRFASLPYEFRDRYPLRVRFPDSEIRGSEGARPYSRLIAACYVLHRLCAPRHPPDALALTLDRSAFVPCPERRPVVALRGIACAMRLSVTQSPFLRMVFAISLGVVWINRSCKPANPAFTMSEIFAKTHERPWRSTVFEADGISAVRLSHGGADRDRTDDLKLAKLALSQLSYGPDSKLVAADGGPGTS